MGGRLRDELEGHGGAPTEHSHIPGVWETGWWGLGNSWRQLAVGQWEGGGVCSSLLLHFAVAWNSPHHPPPPDPLIPPTQGYHPTSLLLEAEGSLTHPQEEKGVLWAHDGGQLFWGARPVFTGQFSNMHGVLGGNQCWGKSLGVAPRFLGRAPD